MGIAVFFESHVKGLITIGIQMVLQNKNKILSTVETA